MTVGVTRAIGYTVLSYNSVPTVSVEVTGHSNGVLAGQNLTLKCEVSGADMLGDISITYNWTRGSSVQVLSTNIQYTFRPTAGDADVRYHCSATLMGGLLTSPITTNTTSQTIRVFGESR